MPLEATSAYECWSSGHWLLQLLSDQKQLSSIKLSLLPIWASSKLHPGMRAGGWVVATQKAEIYQNSLASSSSYTLEALCFPSTLQSSKSYFSFSKFSSCFGGRMMDSQNFLLCHFPLIYSSKLFFNFCFLLLLAYKNMIEFCILAFCILWLC